MLDLNYKLLILHYSLFYIELDAHFVRNKHHLKRENVIHQHLKFFEQIYDI